MKSKLPGKQQKPGGSFENMTMTEPAGMGLRYMELSSIETPRSPGKVARKKGSCGLQRNRQGLFRAKINLEAWSFFSKGRNSLSLPLVLAL